MLSDSESSDGEGLHNLTINEHYAKAFEYKKEREELQKLKEKYGSDFEGEEEDSDSDSESDESEDEDGEELTPAVDAAILRTLARIKRKDPEIYNSEKNIFGEERKKIAPVAKVPRATTKDKSKALTIRQAAINSVLNPKSRSPTPEPLTHDQEQAALRDETIAAFHTNLADEEEDDLLVPREKTKDELELEEEEYKSFLEREVGDINAILAEDNLHQSSEPEEEREVKEKKKDKKKKKNKSGDVLAEEPRKKTKEEADQEFLLNYVLNRGWIDRSAKRVPTYQEVTSSKSKSKGKQKAADELSFGSPEPDSDRELEPPGLPTEDPQIDEDDFEEIVDRFESSYNFRFEEPDAAVIKTYPREMDSTVRRGDTTRKEARERKKARKEEKLLQKKEEIKRLKSLKMKELRSKLEKIGFEGGKNLEQDEALQALDLEGDWDPEAHDREMAALYGDDEGGEEFDEKPQWDDDIDIGDLEPVAAPESKKKTKKKKKKKGEEDDEGVDVDAMDADVKHFIEEEWDGTEEMRKRKLAEYMEEIDGLDFNDMVGDLPTRFKYVPVQPQDHGLTPVEILMATDKELNEFMSIKKFAPYRSGGRWDHDRNERLRELRQKLADRIAGKEGAAAAAAVAEPPKKKRMGKKERMRLKAAGEDDVGGEEGGGELDQGPQLKKRKVDDVDPEDQGGEEGKSANKKKRRKRKHKGDANGVAET